MVDHDEQSNENRTREGDIKLIKDPSVWIATIFRFVFVTGAVSLLFDNVNLALAAGFVAMILPMLVAIVGGDSFVRQ